MRKSVVVLAGCLVFAIVAWVLYQKQGGVVAPVTTPQSAVPPASAQPASVRRVSSASEADADDKWVATAEVVPCRKEPNLQRTPVLSLASGARAYLEQTVEIVSKKENGIVCHAEWVLYVSQPGKDDFISAKAYEHREDGITPDNMHSDASLYYSGRVLGWSGDGRRLLATAYVAAYEDWFQPYPLVYDMTTGKARSVDLKKLFTGRAPKECDLHYDLRGFTAEGNLLVAAEPFEYVEPKDCFTPSVWIVDPNTSHVERAAAPVQPILEYSAPRPTTND